MIMKRFSVFVIAGLLLVSAFVLEGCGRGAIRTRTVWFSDHNVTVVKKPYRGARVKGNKRPIANTSYNRAVRKPGR